MFSNPSAKYCQIKQRKATYKHVTDIKFFQRRKKKKKRQYDCERYKKVSKCDK